MSVAASGTTILSLVPLLPFFFFKSSLAVISLCRRCHFVNAPNFFYAMTFPLG